MLARPGDEAGDSGGDSESGGDSWDRLEARLAAALEALPPDSYLILTPAPGGPASPAAYVQFARAATALTSEAAGNAHLPAEERLDARQQAHLVELGWQLPGAAGDEGHNFRRKWPVPAPAGAVATHAVRTLREVYGVVEPGGLRYRSGSFDGSEGGQADLGLPPDLQPSSRKHRPTGHRSEEELRTLIEDAAKRWLADSDPQPDKDGDYPFRFGSAILYVRIVDDAAPVVAIFSPILREVDSSPELLTALNELNSKIRFGRVVWAHDEVLLVSELSVVDLTADQVAHACLELGGLADAINGELLGRFGGETVFPDRPRLLH